LGLEFVVLLWGVEDYNLVDVHRIQYHPPLGRPVCRQGTGRFFSSSTLMYGRFREAFSLAEIVQAMESYTGRQPAVALE
jgi:hypothetical protein